MAVLTAATLGLGQVGKYKGLAKAIETATDAVGIAETLMELTTMLQADVSMSASKLDIDLPGPAGGPSVQRQPTRAVWEDFEIHAAGQLQRGEVPGIPQMDIVLPGIHNTSGNGMDRIGLRRNQSGKDRGLAFRGQVELPGDLQPRPEALGTGRTDPVR
jgi:hypothetical protein